MLMLVLRYKNEENEKLASWFQIIILLETFWGVFGILFILDFFWMNAKRCEIAFIKVK